MHEEESKREVLDSFAMKSSAEHCSETCEQAYEHQRILLRNNLSRLSHMNENILRFFSVFFHQRLLLNVRVVLFSFQFIPGMKTTVIMWLN